VEELEERVDYSFRLVNHLQSVRDTPALRDALQSIQPKHVAWTAQISQSQSVYALLKQLSTTETDPVKSRIIHKRLMAMELQGIGLSAETRSEFNQVMQELAALQLQFNNNVLDSVKDFRLVVRDPNALKGCSQRLMDSMRVQDAWHLTLDAPTYIPIMEQCTNPTIRRQLYMANVTKASSGDKDNSAILHRILHLRGKVATLLGHPSYAHVSLVSKMASSPANAQQLMDQLYTVALPHAKRELHQLVEFAQQHGIVQGDLQPWDMAHVRERYRQHVFTGFDEDLVAEYFPLDSVMNGMFQLANQLFGIAIERVEPSHLQANVWHPDVHMYQVSDVNGTILSYFYADLFSRPNEKRSGAWMDVCKLRFRQDDTVHLPVAYLVCNQQGPTSDVPSLCKFSHVTTLFHEFGHVLQHILTTVDHLSVSGVQGIEWDVIEVASQFMENFCYDKHWITQLSSHYKTGQSMPDHLICAIQGQRTFLNGLDTLRQLHLGALDLALHSQPIQDAFQLDKDMARKYIFTPRLPQDKFLNSFMHVFGGSYAAGYYSYKWSEVYSADAYQTFQHAESLQEIGRRYRNTLLALGGSVDPHDAWEAFCGKRHASTDALLSNFNKSK
jgi:oligopeptidase A